MRDETRKCCAVSKYIAETEVQRAMRAREGGSKKALCMLIEDVKKWCKNSVELRSLKKRTVHIDFERTNYGILITAYKYLD